MNTAISSRPLIAASCVVGAMALLGLTDNMVVLVAEDTGLWQFHFVRSMMALPLIILAAAFYGRSLRPIKLRAVFIRSFFVSLSMMFYFEALAFVSVAQSSAGLFTAPIFVLLISVAGLGQRVGIWNVLAIFVGFAGVMFVLQPDLSSLSVGTIMPLASGVLYALGAIATRRYCAQENTLSLLFGFFIGITLWGALGCVVLAILQLSVPDGADGFLLRGCVLLSANQWGLIAIQALGAVIGVGLIVRGYLLAEAAFVSVFEYTLLMFGGFWGWVLWSQTMNALAYVGIALIVLSGIVLSGIVLSGIVLARAER